MLVLFVVHHQNRGIPSGWELGIRIEAFYTSIRRFVFKQLNLSDGIDVMLFGYS